MRRPLLHAVYPVLYRLRRLYRRVARPRTFGVRVLIRHSGTGAVLLVRHSYGPRRRWYPPGGGYDPRRESPEDAARREVHEEVGIVLDDLVALGVDRTDAGGNRDEIRLFAAVTRADARRGSAEIADHGWFGHADLAGDMPLARVTREALRRAGVARRQSAPSPRAS